MSKILPDISRTFNEFLLLPNLTDERCIPANVSLRTPLVKFKKGEQAKFYANVPMVSAIMQSVSGEKMGIALAREGGLAFIYGSQSIESQAEMVYHVKKHKAGFVISDSNVKSGTTLKEVLELVEKTGHSTVIITDDGTASGKFLGIVTNKDYRLSRDNQDEPIDNFMTKKEDVIWAKKGITLSEANDIIWDKKINCLPILTEEGNLKYLVFRKDYEDRKNNPNSLLDENKRYIVGAGINTRDYEERIPALVEAGVDSYIPYAGSLKDNLEITVAKIKSTMCNCGATTIPELHEKARLTMVSEVSISEGGAHDVTLKEIDHSYKS